MDFEASKKMAGNMDCVLAVWRGVRETLCEVKRGIEHAFSEWSVFHRKTERERCMRSVVVGEHRYIVKYGRERKKENKCSVKYVSEKERQDIIIRERGSFLCYEAKLVVQFVLRQRTKRTFSYHAGVRLYYSKLLSL